MNCPHCRSTATSRRKHRTALGHHRFSCRSCRHRFNERTGTPFDDLQFPTDIVLLAVLWSLRYKLGLRDVAELLLHRGCEVTHETVRSWEFRFTSLLGERLRTRHRGQAGGRSWYFNETYVKVSGRWRYLYCVINRDGNLLDSMLSEQRDRSAARPFLRRLADIAMHKLLRLTPDQHSAYGKAIRWILGRKVLHRQSRYLNNRIEQHHQAIKQRYYPVLGFGGMESAKRFCSALKELRHYLRMRPRLGKRVSLSERRRVFLARWQALMAETAAV